MHKLLRPVADWVKLTGGLYYSPSLTRLVVFMDEWVRNEESEKPATLGELMGQAVDWFMRRKAGRPLSSVRLYWAEMS